MRKRQRKSYEIANPLEDLLGYQLRRAAAATLARLTGRYEELGFRLTEASTLIIIEANPGIKQSDIGRMLDIRSANMAPLVGNLEKRNYVERKQLDGRSQGLYLSNEGAAIAKKIRQCIDENENWILSRLPKPDKQAALSQLKSIWS
jgi:DNA-binding MarR family transcriptional regulator